MCYDNNFVAMKVSGMQLAILSVQKGFKSFISMWNFKDSYMAVGNTIKFCCQQVYAYLVVDYILILYILIQFQIHDSNK